MRASRVLAVAIVLLGIACRGGGSFAQAPSASPTATAAPPADLPDRLQPAVAEKLGVREAKPDVFWMKDKRGDLVPVVGFTLEDFERLLRREQGVGEEPKPEYRFDTVELVGTTDDRYARFDAKFVVNVDAANWVRVPLDLRGAVVEKQVEYKGPGKFALQFDAQRREYAVWLQGAGDKPHELLLKIVQPLERITGHQGLRLNLPRTWHAGLSLTVPQTGVVAQVSTGAVLEEVKPAGKATLIRASGIGGELQVTWGHEATGGRQAQVLLEANADVLAIVDGRSIAYEAQFTVNSFGGEFDRFQVRLPPGAALVDEGLADVELTRVMENGKTETAPLYEVRRTAGTTKSMAIRLKALRSLAKQASNAAIEFGGFEVLGAVRQWGYLGVVVEGEWHVLWGKANQIRQVDANPEAFRGRDLAAVFEYFGRPYALEGRVVQRETRITVDPTYAVEVGAKKVQLTATLPYRIGGAKVFSLAVDFPGWQIDEVGPAEIVDVAALAPAQAQPLVIPLLQPSTGDFQIVVRAHHDLASEATSLDLRVPYPKGGVVGEATFTVHAAENIELSPHDALHGGLLRQTSPAVQGSDRGKSWSYTTDASDARFRADVRVLKRTIAVRSAAEVELRGDGGKVVQRFSYAVTREPIDGLEFDVPAGVSEHGRLEVKLAGESIPWVVIDEGSAEQRRPSRIRVELPAPRLGDFELSVEYPLEEQTAVPQASVSVRVPLLVPTDAAPDRNELTVVGPRGLEIQHIDDGWSPVANKDERPRTAATVRSWTAADARSEVALGIRWDVPEPSDDTTVERLWVQSIVPGAIRQERAVFRLRTGATSLRLRMPAGATSVTMTGNGARLDVEDSSNAGEITAPLKPSPDGVYVVDVRYRLVGGDSGTYDLPRLVGDPPIRHVYRQIVFPADVCLLQFSEAVLPEFEWAWQGPILTRRPLLSQAELENWVGGRHEAPVTDRSSTYLFSSFGDSPRLAIRTVKRTTLVFASSAAVLVFCLALLYLPPLRHPALLIAAAIGVAGCGLAYPDVAPLVAQAAAVGAVLGFTAVVLERNVNRRRRRVLRLPAEAASGSQRDSTKTRASGRPIGAPMSTATADLPAAAFPESSGAS